MNKALAIMSQYPHADPLRDFRVQDDNDGNGQYIAYWNVKDASGNVVPEPTDAELGQWWIGALRSQKIAELRTGYMQTLAGGFNETVSGTVYTFGWTTSDESNLDAVRAAVASGFLTFPVQYADVHGNPVSIPDQTTLDNIEHTASNFMAAQHQQVLTLIGNVQAVSNTDPNAETTLNGITWSPATYTQV